MASALKVSTSAIIAPGVLVWVILGCVVLFILCRLLIKDVDKFQKYASGFNSIIIAFGLVVAGVWTVFAFYAKQDVLSAQANYEKLVRELQELPKLVVDLELKQFKTGQADKYIGEGILTFNNIGSGPVVLDLNNADESPLVLYEVNYSSRHEALTELATFYLPGDMDRPLVEVKVEPGASIQPKFSFSVPRPGLYSVVLRVPKSEVDKRRDEESGSKRTDIGYWFAIDYIWME